MGCHPACCMFFCVCMVLTSSAGNLCQVWSGLTFSHSRHVFGSPMLRYLSEKKKKYSAPPPRALFSAPSPNLHHILVHFLLFMLNVQVFCSAPLCLASNFFLSLCVTLISFISFLFGFFFFLPVCEHSLKIACSTGTGSKKNGIKPSYICKSIDFYLFDCF